MAYLTPTARREAWVTANVGQGVPEQEARAKAADLDRRGFFATDRPSTTEVDEELAAAVAPPPAVTPPDRLAPAPPPDDEMMQDFYAELGENEKTKRAQLLQAEYEESPEDIERQVREHKLGNAIVPEERAGWRARGALEREIESGPERAGSVESILDPRLISLDAQKAGRAEGIVQEQETVAAVQENLEGKGLLATLAGAVERNTTPMSAEQAPKKSYLGAIGDVLLETALTATPLVGWGLGRTEDRQATLASAVRTFTDDDRPSIEGELARGYAKEGGILAMPKDAVGLASRAAIRGGAAERAIQAVRASPVGILAEPALGRVERGIRLTQQMDAFDQLTDALEKADATDALEDAADYDGVKAALSWADYPEEARTARPSVARAREMIDLGQVPEGPFARVAEALEENRPVPAIQEMLDRMPIGALPEPMRVESTPGDALIRRVGSQRRTLLRQTGGDATAKLEDLMRAMGTRTELVAGQPVIVESGLGHVLRVAGASTEPFKEADIPVFGPLAWAFPGLTPQAMKDLRVPTPAGLDRMAASRTGEKIRHALGIAENYEPVRADDSTWLARVLASMETGRQGFATGYLDVAYQAGVPEGSELWQLTGLAGTALDTLGPWEEALFKPAVWMGRAGKRFRAVRTVVPEGARAEAFAATTFPRLYAERVGLRDADATTALDAVVRRYVMGRLARGEAPDAILDALPRGTRDMVEEVIRQVEDPARVKEALRSWAAQAQPLHADAIRQALDGGTPAMKELRASPEYQRVRQELAALVDAGHIDAGDVPILLAAMEVQAHRLAADPRVAQIGRPEDYFRAHVFRVGGTPGAGAMFEIGSHTMSPEEVLAGLRSARFIPDSEVLRILGSNRPEYLDAVSAFILEQREKVRSGRLTNRDVAKAYLMTVASPRAQAIDPAKVQEVLGAPINPIFLSTGVSGRQLIRPEEAMAAWLFTPDGQRALDAIERGEFDAEAWESAARVRDAYGANTVRGSRMLEPPGKGQVTFHNISEVTDAINAAQGDPGKVAAALVRLKGINEGKDAFIAHLLGFGEAPTIDSVVINGWLTGRGNVGSLKTPKADLARGVKVQSDRPSVVRAVADRIMRRYRQLRETGVSGTQGLPDEVFGAVMHHWLWDRLKGTETTHAGMYHAMQYAQTVDSKVRGSLTILPAGPESTTRQAAADLRLGFYSALRRAAEDMPERMKAESLRNWLKKQGVKDEEMEWSGVDRFLADRQGQVTQEDVLEWLDENAIQVREVVRGGPPADVAARRRQALMAERDRLDKAAALARRRGDDDAAAQLEKQLWAVDAQEREAVASLDEKDVRFSDYSLPGGENYRELLLTMPAREGDAGYKGPHWKEPNVLVHVRFNDRVTPDGKRVLFVEEVQSDWGQKGRDVGFGGVGDDIGVEDRLDELLAEREEISDWMTDDPDAPSFPFVSETDARRFREVSDEYDRLVAARLRTTDERPPPMPFAETYHQLAMKRVLRLAAERGYDAVAWTPGKVQAERYSLNKVVDSLEWNKNTGLLYGKKGGADVGKWDADSPEAVAALVGKENARRLAERADAEGGIGAIGGEDVTVGGRGMEEFYDRALPNFMAKYTKKWGGKVEKAEIGTDNTGRLIDDGAGGLVREGGGPPKMEAVHSVSITPEMRADLVELGQPLFQRKPGKQPTGSIEFDAKAQQYVIRLFKGGDLGTLWHENGHLVRHLMGDDWHEALVHNFESAADGQGGRRLTARGEEQVADAWKWYMRTRRASNGVVHRLFEALRLALQDLWLRARGQGQALPPEMRDLWDSWLRPEEVVDGPAVDAVYRTLAKMPEITVAPTQGQRLAEGKPARAGAGREATRVDTDTVRVRQALGVADDTAKVDAADLFARAVAYVTTERARTALPGDELVRLTNRTIVPASRHERIRTEVRATLDDVAGGDVAKLTPQRGTLHLEPSQQAGLRGLVNRLAREPMGNALPEWMLDPQADLSRVSVRDWNRVAEVLVDVSAGVAARRSYGAEAVPATVGYALWKGLVQAVDKVGETTPVVRNLADRIRKTFVVQRVGDKIMSPAMQELFEAAMRDLSDIPDWIKRVASRTRYRDPAEWMPQALADLREQVVPPIAPDHAGQLLDLVETLGTMRPAADTNSAGALAVADLYPQLDAIEAILEEVEPGTGVSRITAQERAAVRLLRALGLTDEVQALIDNPDTKAAKLDDQQRAALGDALRVIHTGLSGRAQILREAASDIVGALGGAPKMPLSQPKVATSTGGAEATGMSPLAVNLPWRRPTPDPEAVAGRNLLAQGSFLDFYDRFFAGDWTGMLDIASGLGMRTGREVGSVPKFEEATAFIEVVARLRAREIMARLAQQMAEQGIRARADALTAGRPMGALDRDKFVRRVAWYINNDTSYKKFVTRQQGVDEPVVAPSPPPPDLFGPEKVPTATYEMATGETVIHDLEAFTVAQEVLAEWGFRHEYATWDVKTLKDGSQALMPDYLYAEISAAGGRAANIGSAWLDVKARMFGDPPPTAAGPPVQRAPEVRAKMKMGATVDALLGLWPFTARMIRTGFTTGFGLGHPAYFIGNFVGSIAATWEGLGPLKTITSFAKHNRFKAAVTTGLWGNGQFLPDAPALVTADGRIYTVPQVVEAARQQGLKGSFIETERARSLEEDLERMQPGLVNRLIQAPGWWQDFLAEVSSASDNWFRVNAFVDALADGKSVVEAAELGRKIGFDYSALTDIEKTWFRSVIFFYGFLRRNQDLFWDTLFTHPERVLGVLRMLRGLNGLYLQDDPEVVLPDYLQGRLGVYFRTTSANHVTLPQTLFVAPMLNPIAAVKLWVDALSAIGGDQEALRRLTSDVAPWMDAPYVLPSERDPTTGIPIDANSVVPRWLVETDKQLTGGALVDRIFEVYPNVVADPSRLDHPSGMEWRAGNAKAWWIWRNLTPIPPAGRYGDMFTALDRANVGAVETIVNVSRAIGERQTHPSLRGDTAIPREGLTAMDEAWGLFTTRPQQIQSRQVAKSRLIKRQTAGIKNETRDMQKAQGR